MKDKIPVKDENGLVRDVSSKAILSVDKQAIRLYEERRRKIETDKNRLNRLEAEMAELRQVIEELRKK